MKDRQRLRGRDDDGLVVTLRARLDMHKRILRDMPVNDPDSILQTSRGRFGHRGQRIHCEARGMPPRPRAARYSFIASIELTDLEPDHKTVEKTMDLSLFGCHVVPGNSSPAGRRLRLQITHNGEVFEVVGRRECSTHDGDRNCLHQD
jgi:hypothetical protein